MLRILLFSPKGAGNHYYGPGMNAYRMYKRLPEESGVSLSLAHGYRNQEKDDLFEEQYFISDVVNKNLFLGGKFLVKAKKWVKRNARKFDVVHCLTAFQHSFMFSLWCEQQGVPALIKIGQSDHTGFNENSPASRLLGLSRFRLNHANDITGYISISDSIYKKLRQAGIEAGKIHRIPNGVDTERFYPAGPGDKSRIRKTMGLQDRFTVLFTGAFSERKNPLLIAKAFRKFRKNDDIQLLLIGPDTDNGEQRQAIETLIREKNITNIHVMDFVKDIAAYYRASDLFVLPSNQEGFSNSMLEAQASGLPAVVTKISGSEDLIRPGVNGRFIELHPDSISEAINDYFKNRKQLETHAKAAREAIETTYSSDIVLKQYLDLFHKTAAGISVENQ